MSATEAVQRALVGAMRADVTLQALVGDRVFDDVPEAAEHPYISLGPEDWRPLDDDCIDAQDGVVQIDIWSREPGRIECRQITDAVEALFHGAEIAVDGTPRVVLLRVILKRVIAEDLQRHGVVQLDIKIDEVPE